MAPSDEPVADPDTVIHAGGELENAMAYLTPRERAALSTRRCVASCVQSQVPSRDWCVCVCVCVARLITLSIPIKRVSYEYYYDTIHVPLFWKGT